MTIPVVAAAAFVALLLLSVAGSARAHFTDIPHDLGGVRLCVDEESIDLRFERGGAPVEHAVRQRLERFLTALLDGAGVAWSSAAACPPDRGYLSVRLDVSEAPWFAPRASAYRAAVQVGPRSRSAEGRPVAEPADAFDFRVAKVYDEVAVGIPAFVFLPRYLEAALRDLTVAWWLDQPPPAPPRPHAPAWAPVAAAAGLVALLAALTFTVRFRRGA